MNFRDFYRQIEHTVKEQELGLKYLHFTRTGQKPEKQVLVMKVDGRHYHGGLNDRFKGIVSSYAYCKQRGMEFRILYTYPFPLTDYLVPAEYDWTLKEGEYSDCIFDSRILYYRSEYGQRLLRLKTGKQIHFYGNTDFLDILNRTGRTSYRWGELFRELFRPVPELAGRLDRLKQDIGTGYNAAVFRFQNLLGDFPEYGFKPLATESGKNLLMEKCLESVREIISRSGKEYPLLVTSDSTTFLHRAAEIEGVSIIRGKPVHMDGSGKNSRDKADYMKSFLDFFMLAGARKIACFCAPGMYPSQFPMYAAKINDIPFERITLE